MENIHDITEENEDSDEDDDSEVDSGDESEDEMSEKEEVDVIGTLLHRIIKPYGHVVTSVEDMLEPEFYKALCAQFQEEVLVNRTTNTNIKYVGGQNYRLL